MSALEAVCNTCELKALIIENNNEQKSFLKELVNKLGLEDVICNNGKEALKIIKKENIDIILSNVILPDSDGFTVALNIKKNLGEFFFIPVILFSSDADKKIKIKGLSCADDVFCQPFDTNEICARINNLLKIKKLQNYLLKSQSDFERQKKQARLQLYRSARMASIGTFASGIAHELNNPLTAILGCSGALLERVKNKETIEDEDLKEYIQIIYQESVKCRDIVENLLNFSREKEIKIEDFFLYNCVNDACSLIKPKAEKKNIKINIKIPLDIKVRADNQKLLQAIINVVTNSIDFCNNGSLIEIWVEIEDKFAKLYIKDNGPGISPEILQNIFDPFFTTKEVGKGIGLGLAITHFIMDEIYGKINVQSEVSKGTTVILEIPCAN